MTSIILDLEANGLLDLADTIWCICVYDLVDGTTRTFTDQVVSNTKPLKYFKSYLNSISEIIGHNIITYDIPLMEKLLGIDFAGIKLTDTLVISRRLDPDRDMKRHGIEDWARRLGGRQKVVQEQWHTFEPNMITRCQSDVEINHRVYLELKKEVERNEKRD